MTTMLKMPAIAGIKLSKPTFEEVTLYRIQLKLTTGVGKGAGTDDVVFVQLNNLDKQFFLRKGVDNFIEGHTEIYDILPSNVKKVKDIQFLNFGVRGNDGVCLKKIELFFNGNINPVFSKSYSGSGSCIDNDTTEMAKNITIQSDELRSSVNWKYNSSNDDIWQPLQCISKEMILSMVEAAIGNQITIANNGLAWGSKGGVDTIWGAAVEVNFVDKKTLHFDLDLQKTIKGPNPEIDVDFDLEFNCQNGIITTAVKNVRTGTNWVGSAEGWLISTGIPMLARAIAGVIGYPEAGTAAGGLLSKFLSFSLNFDPQSPNSSISCKTINITPNCDIMLF